jgi:hypothetical protein
MTFRHALHSLQRVEHPDRARGQGHENGKCQKGGELDERGAKQVDRGPKLRKSPVRASPGSGCFPGRKVGRCSDSPWCIGGVLGKR